jgi:MATE family multidrug resistance protein
MMIASLRPEFRPMLRLAAPLAVAELAWMAMGVVDTLMLAPMGSAAIGAGSMGGMVFYTVAICGTGLLLGMDTLISQSFGAGDLPDCRRSLIDGLWFSLLLLPVIMGGTFACLPLLHWYGINPRVYEQLVPFLTPLVWSIIPLFAYAALRRYLQAVHVVKPVTFAIVSANLINFAGNWILIYGHWGAPAMGIRGSAWSTCVARLYMALVLAGATARHGAFRKVSWLPRFSGIRTLLALGLPASLQMGFEAAVFAIVTAFACRLDEASLAAHSIALNVISVTYMVPLGISSAAAVRVGSAVGRADPRGVAVAGWAALLLSAGFMGTAAIVLFTMPEVIVRRYSGDPRVMQVGVSLLAIAALFELGDGANVVATGALRGAGDTRTSMLANLIFYWAVGLPVAYLMCFHFGWGADGLWLGLCVALLLIGGTLIGAWIRLVRRIQNDHEILV